MRWIKAPLAVLLAVSAGWFLFVGNLHTDDTGIIAGLIVIFAAVLGFAFGRMGLLLGSLLGLSIIGSELWNLRFGTAHSSTHTLRDFVLLFLFVTGLSVVGSLTGFGVRRMITHAVRGA